MAITIPNDAIATIKLNFTDNVGSPLAGEPGTTPGVGVTVADPTVASAVLADDGQSVTITPLKLAGGSTVAYADTNDNISGTVDFALGNPVPSSMTFDESGVSLSKNPNPPTS